MLLMNLTEEFQVFFHNASIGLALSSILSIVKNITKPGKIPAALISRDNLKMPLFFGLLPAIYHVSTWRVKNVVHTIKKSLVLISKKQIEKPLVPNKKVNKYICAYFSTEFCQDHKISVLVLDVSMPTQPSSLLYSPPMPETSRHYLCSRCWYVYLLLKYYFED